MTHISKNGKHDSKQKRKIIIEIPETNWFMNALMWWWNWFMKILRWWLYCTWIQGPVNLIGFWMFLFGGENWSTDILLGLDFLPLPAVKTFRNFNWAIWWSMVWSCFRLWVDSLLAHDSLAGVRHEDKYAALL